MSAQESVDIPEFVRAVKASNPFISNRVTQADLDGVDVTSIHEKEFRRLVRCVQAVRESHGTAGVLLLGAAGVGKSHLLGRVFRWARDDRTATVVYLHNVLASPERLPRYLLRATMSSLAGHRPWAYPQSELYALINRAIQSSLAGRGGAPELSTRVRVLRELGEEIDPENLVMPVFIAFLEQVVDASRGKSEAELRSKAAVEWLSGESVEPPIAAALGLSGGDEDGACLPDDVAVQRAFDVISRLCGKAGRPLVLCVDQVDNLDAEKVTALTSFLHATLDNGHDLVVVTSGVKQSMLSFERDGVIPQAAWDRLAQFTVELNKVGAADARAIVQERIERFMVPFKRIDSLRRLRSKEPLLPLRQVWLDRYAQGIIEVRPRDAINKAREQWEEAQDLVEERGTEAWLKSFSEHTVVFSTRRPPRDRREVIDELVAKKVKEATAERLLHPEGLPSDADNLATLAFGLLEVCQGQERYSLRSVQRIRSRAAVRYDLKVAEKAPGGAQVESGVIFVATDNAIKSAWALRRLVEDEQPPTHQVLVTDEERRPLRLGAKGQEYLERLRKGRRFKHIGITFEHYAGLDALSVVLATARVGDLEIENPPGEVCLVSEEECLESLHRQGYFLANPALRELLTEEAGSTTVSPPAELLAEDVIRQRIAAELHWRLGMTVREMTEVLIAREGLRDRSSEHLRPRVSEVARKMHGEGHLYAAAQDDDLFLQFRKQVYSSAAT